MENYENFRDNHLPDTNLRIESCEVEISLLNNKRARFVHRFKNKNLSAKNESHWLFESPYSNREINFFWAKDDSGGLEYNQLNPSKNKTTIYIKFRKDIAKDESYAFSFGYETPISTIVMSNWFHETVVYNGWFIHDSPCVSMVIRIQLPEKSYCIKSMPPIHNEQDWIVYSATELAPLKELTYFFVYRKSKIGMAFWNFLASAVLSGIIGSILGLLIN